MAIRTRSWIMWVLAPLAVVVVAVTVLCWHPVPPRNAVGDEIVVNGHRIALPLVRCGFDTFLDGGSHVMPCEDRTGEIHVFVCRWPGYGEILHQHLGKTPYAGSLDTYGTVVPDDDEVRNLLYWTLEDRARTAGVSSFGIKDLYPSLSQQWFGHGF